MRNVKTGFRMHMPAQNGCPVWRKKKQAMYDRLFQARRPADRGRGTLSIVVPQ